MEYLNSSVESSQIFYIAAAIMALSSVLFAYQANYLVSGLMALSGVGFILAGYLKSDKDEKE